MDLMERRRELLSAFAPYKLELNYRKGLPRYPVGDAAADNNANRCSTSKIAVSAGDFLKVLPPDGYKVALGVWKYFPVDDKGRSQPELYGGWDANLEYTVKNDGCFARYVYCATPTEKGFNGGELDGQIKIYVNGRLYYA